MSKLKACVPGIGAVAAACSAFCWWRSAVARVPHAGAAGATGAWRDASVSLDGADLFPTMRAQAKWNRWAAVFACIAAAAQFLQAVLPS